MSLAQDFVRAADPAALAESVGVKLYRWQRSILGSRHRRIALTASRQAGKSLTLAMLGLHVALFQPQSRSVILSASEDQARIAFSYAVAAYQRLSRPVDATAMNKRSLELSNGSELIVRAASPTTIRGYSSSFLGVDEAAFIDDDLFAAVFPSLAAVEGRVLLSSTPNGKRGVFASIFLSDDPAWHRVTIKASDCPHISQADIEQYRRQFGEDRTREEFYCEFLDSERQAFASGDVDRALGKVEAWNL